MVHKPQFWDLFVCPAFKGVKLQILGWIAYYSWGQPDWDNLVDGKPENRKFTEKPIRAYVIARDIGAHRKRVSAAIVELRNLGVLIQDENGGEGINKKTLAELPKWTKSETGRTSTQTGTVHINGDACPQKGGRFEGSVHKKGDANPRNNTPDNELPVLQTSSDIQTNNPAASRRPNYKLEALVQTIHKKFGLEEQPAKLQLALNECETSDLHPLDLIDHATHNWFGFVKTACSSPDGYRDQVRSYTAFVEEVTPVNPKAVEIMEKVVAGND